MAPATPNALPPTRYRWVICALLFWVTTANYIDRGVFGNLAPELEKQNLFTSDAYWWMGVAFSGAYAVSLLIAGRLMDVLGLRWGFTLACAFWGLAAMSHSLVSTAAGFIVMRILLAFGEGGNFPAAIKTTAEWFPKRERALATGIFNSGSNIGGVLVPWGLPYLVAWFSTFPSQGHALGWRGVFLVTGIFDLGWIVAWLLIYKRPQDHPRVSKAELELINSDPPESQIRIPWRRLFPLRQAWAFAAGKFMTDCFWWFYLLGSAQFLSDRFHMSLRSRSGPVAAIYVFASVGSIGGGWLSGHFMKRGWSVNKARKITLLIFGVLVAPVSFAGITLSSTVAVVLIAVAAAAHQAFSSNLFSLTSDMFPRRIVASVTGFGGFFGSVGGMALFFLVSKMHSNYVLVFVAAGVSYVAAVGIIHLLVPRLEIVPVEKLTSA